MLLTQCLESRLRLLNSSSFSTRVKSSRLSDITLRSIRSEIWQDQRVVGLRELETCLRASDLKGALQNDSGRANVSLFEQHACTRDQFRRLHAFVRIDRSIDLTARRRGLMLNLLNRLVFPVFDRLHLDWSYRCCGRLLARGLAAGCGV